MKNIILIGMSGSGKTSVGKFIAKKLGMNFKDTDSIVVYNNGMSISYIFDNYGEEHFRDLEKKVVEDLSSMNKLVISTGGGVILDRDNISILKRNGIVYFLKANIDTLVKNLESSNQNHRPLLSKDQKLKVQITKLYEKRKDIYFLNADNIVTADNRSIEEIGNYIISVFEQNNSCDYF